MHTEAITDGDGQRTQVGPDPLDYVLRYAACDYDCYYQDHYIGSRPTLPKAIEVVEYEQTKAARHPQLSPSADATIATYQEELRAIAARLHDLAKGLAGHPTEQAPLRAPLTMAHIHISAALRSIQGAERSLRLVGHATEAITPLDAVPDTEEHHYA
jgi:hypothetical protein